MLQTFRRGFHHKTGNDLEGSHRLADPAVAHQYVGSKTSDKRFAHKALDETQSSIRLVTVSSELSSDGSIQCYISHSTLDRASYVCLSYTWGTSEAQSRILINGLPFHVSKNVFDFLDMVRTMPMTFYWIDTLCIDQSNIPERNKQVGQMGQIYSKAFLVYLWLGKLPSMAPFMRYFDGSKNAESVRKSFWENTPEARDIVKTQILNHEYWNRAWVTQEICMARAVLVTLCRESFKLPDFISTMRKFDQFEPGSFRNSLFAPFAETASNISKLHSKSLMNLLDESREKKCAIPRDRIFSMLPLASNFQLPEAKYDQPSEDLAYDVLRRADEPLCICSALLVAQTLRLASKRTLEEEIRGSTITALEFDIRSLRFSRHAMLCNDKIHSWAHYKIIGTDIFGHDLLLTDLCPALYALMGTLQDRAMNKNPTSEEALATPITAVPYLLKMMDEEHAQAILGSLASTLNIEQHPADQGTTIFRVALRILPKLVPENIPLCRRVALGKARKTEMDREAASPNPYAMDPSFAAQSREARGSRDFRAREASIFRIDSANSNRGFEDDGPVSGLRLRRIPISPSG